MKVKVEKRSNNEIEVSGGNGVGDVDAVGVYKRGGVGNGTLHVQNLKQKKEDVRRKGVQCLYWILKCV